MAISERTIKILFAKSLNRCAMPQCQATLVVGDTVLGEICHIRARRKGARHDPSLTVEQKDSLLNLILLCPTCHTLVDNEKRGTFTVEMLEGVKTRHERSGGIELTPEISSSALAILAKHNTKGKQSIKNSDVTGAATSTAGSGAVSIAIGGNNQGDIHVRMPSAKGARGHPKNSIGADANLTGYIDYLCELWVKYMSRSESDAATLWAPLGKQIKTKFRLAKRTRNDLPAEKFEPLVRFLYEKLSMTPAGRRNLSRGKKICSSFEEWRNTTR